jgi:hypothetical protein
VLFVKSRSLSPPIPSFSDILKVIKFYQTSQYDVLRGVTIVVVRVGAVKIYVTVMEVVLRVWDLKKGQKKVQISKLN